MLGVVPFKRSFAGVAAQSMNLLVMLNDLDPLDHLADDQRDPDQSHWRQRLPLVKRKIEIILKNQQGWLHGR